MSNFEDLQYTLDEELISANGLISRASELDSDYADDWMKSTSAAARVLRDHGHTVGRNQDG